MGRLMDYSIGRLQMSSVLCFTVYQTIYRINHLFQNGRALLKCRIFIPPTSGDPDVMSKTEQHLQPCSLIEIERQSSATCTLLSHRARALALLFGPPLSATIPTRELATSRLGGEL